MNTVFHFYVNLTNPQQLVLKSSRINSVNIPGIGFGKSVAWLNDTTAVILANNVSMDYTDWYASRIEIYDLSDGKQLNDTQGPLSFFPNWQQSMPTTIPGPIVLIAASYAISVTLMNDKGLVYMVNPSPPGHSGVTSVANRRGTNLYFSSSMMCPSGSDRVEGSDIKYIFSPCKLCQTGSYSDGSAQASVGCSGCNTNTYFCSLGAVAQVPMSYLENKRQIVYSTESTSQLTFDDILLSNMFDLNLQAKCLVTTPMFWTLTLIGLTLIFYLVMIILHWTGKCLTFQATVQTVLKHFDLINDGQVSDRLWTTATGHFEESTRAERRAKSLRVDSSSTCFTYISHFLSRFSVGSVVYCRFRLWLWSFLLLFSPRHFWNSIRKRHPQHLSSLVTKNCAIRKSCPVWNHAEHKLPVDQAVFSPWWLNRTWMWH